MGFKIVTWLVLLELISLIVGHPMLDETLRKHFYGASSEEKVIQNKSEEDDGRAKRLVEEGAVVNGLDPEILKRYYADDKKKCGCKEKKIEELTTTTKPKKKKRKTECHSTTTEEPITTSCQCKTTIPITTSCQCRTTTRKPRTSTPTTRRTTTTKKPTTTSSLTSTSTTRKPSTTTTSPSTTTSTTSRTTTTSTTATKPEHPRFPFHPLLPNHLNNDSAASSEDSSDHSLPGPHRHRQPSIYLRPDCTDVESCAQHRDAIRRILRRLNRLGPSDRRSDSELDHGPLKMDTVGLRIPRHRTVGVAPVVMSYDRARDVREDGDGEACRRPEEDRQYLRTLRRAMREVKRSLRMRRNELPQCRDR